MRKSRTRSTSNVLCSDPSDVQEPVRQIIKAYSRFVPEEIIALMDKGGINSVGLGDNIEKTMTILFTDMRNFTALSEEMTPQENFSFINSYMAYMSPVIARNGGMINKYIGDAIMALFPGSADDALQCAIDMLNQLVPYNKKLNKSGRHPVKAGVGLNTGLMMLGIIGGERFMETTVISDAVNLASRIESMTKDYRTPLLISEHTYYSLKDASRYHIRFIDRVKVKGKSQCQSVYEVFDADPERLRKAKDKTKVMFEEALAHYHFKEIPVAMEMLSECLHQAPEDAVAGVYHERCERFLKTGIHESSGEFDLVISWNKTLAVDNSFIDDQHRELFRQARNFAGTVGSATDYSQLCSAIGFLEEYIKVHFDAEERFMAEKNYPFLQMQIDQHRRFSKYFDKLKNEISENVKTNKVFLLFRVQTLVIDWLMNHTSKLDRHFGKFLRQQAQGD